MSVLRKNNVQVSGQGQVMLFAHGYGCDQSMWRHVAPRFADTHQVVLFDHVGAGNSELSAYDPQRYASLDQYADDVLAICAALDARDVIFVGHSVSAMIGVLAARRKPEQFSRLVLVGPSPCYLNDGDYPGGFSRHDIDELLAFLDDNFVAWAESMAPVIMGNPERPELGAELRQSFCKVDPTVARQFARVTFLSDTRAELASVQVPTLILQCTSDAIAPDPIGQYVHQAIGGSTLVRLQATGHCPNMSAPLETTAAIRAFLS